MAAGDDLGARRELEQAVAEPSAEGLRHTRGAGDIEQADRDDLGSGGAQRAHHRVELGLDGAAVERRVEEVVAARGDDREIRAVGERGGELLLADLGGPQPAPAQVEERDTRPSAAATISSQPPAG